MRLTEEHPDIYIANQRRKERLCARTLKGKALLVIDHLITNIEPEDKLLGKIYRIAHCATGVCCNHHEGWVEEVNATYKALGGKDEVER